MEKKKRRTLAPEEKRFTEIAAEKERISKSFSKKIAHQSKEADWPTKTGSSEMKESKDKRSEKKEREQKALSQSEKWPENSIVLKCG